MSIPLNPARPSVDQVPSCPACGPECGRDHPAGPTFVMHRGYTLDEAKGSVGKGWHGLLEAFWERWDLNKDQADWKDLAVIQVKEKFGTLRVYVSGGTDRTHDLIGGLEMASSRICEACGSPGRLRSEKRSWILTLCDGCDAKPLEELRREL